MKQILRPTGDLQTEWYQIDSYPHYSVIDEAVEQPDGEGDGDQETGAGMVIAGKGATGPGVIDRFSFGTFALEGESIYKVKVWFYLYVAADPSVEMYVDIKLGSWIGTKTIVMTYTGAMAWYSAEWTGLNNNQSELDALEVKIQADTEFLEEEGILIDVLYVEIYYHPHNKKDVIYVPKESKDVVYTPADTKDIVYAPVDSKDVPYIPVLSKDVIYIPKDEKNIILEADD